jgi:hypothetical protein
MVNERRNEMKINGFCYENLDEACLVARENRKWIISTTNGYLVVGKKTAAYMAEAEGAAIIKVGA